MTEENIEILKRIDVEFLRGCNIFNGLCFTMDWALNQKVMAGQKIYNFIEIREFLIDIAELIGIQPRVTKAYMFNPQERQRIINCIIDIVEKGYYQP